MAALLFRCTNQNCEENGKPCQFEFTLTMQELHPTCPKCGIKGDHPLFGHKLQQLTRTHFNPPSHVPGVSLDVRACNPAKSIQVGGGALANGLPNAFHNGTRVTSAVNCPECRATKAFESAFLAEHGDEPPEMMRQTLDKLEQFRLPAPV